MYAYKLKEPKKLVLLPNIRKGMSNSMLHTIKAFLTVKEICQHIIFLVPISISNVGFVVMLKHCGKIVSYKARRLVEKKLQKKERKEM